MGIKAAVGKIFLKGTSATYTKETIITLCISHFINLLIPQQDVRSSSL